jgi:hypothetical protein
VLVLRGERYSKVQPDYDAELIKRHPKCIKTGITILNSLHWHLLLSTGLL